MKVLLSCASFQPDYGGPARSVSRLALALADAGSDVGLWAPDGSALAFFDTQDRSRKGHPDTGFTAMTADLDTGTTHTLMYAGHCACLGLAPPTLAWSPDGSGVAVSTTKGGERPCVVLVSADGSEVEQLGYAVVGLFALAWGGAVLLWRLRGHDRRYGRAGS